MPLLFVRNTCIYVQNINMLTFITSDPCRPFACDIVLDVQYLVGHVRGCARIIPYKVCCEPVRERERKMGKFSAVIYGCKGIAKREISYELRKKWHD